MSQPLPRAIYVPTGRAREYADLAIDNQEPPRYNENILPR